MTPINVLIVDDDETDRYIARRQLAKNHAFGSVVEAADGLTAYELLDSDRFEELLGPHPPRALVLLDINMPRMSGFELLDTLAADTTITQNDISVIVMLTSSSHFGDRERAQRFDLVDGYVEKPLTPDKIAMLLEEFWPSAADAR